MQALLSVCFRFSFLSCMFGARLSFVLSVCRIHVVWCVVSRAVNVLSRLSNMPVWIDGMCLFEWTGDALARIWISVPVTYNAVWMVKTAYLMPLAVSFLFFPFVPIRFISFIIIFIIIWIIIAINYTKQLIIVVTMNCIIFVNYQLHHVRKMQLI